jgi:predicted cobalt transporter CbtA
VLSAAGALALLFYGRSPLAIVASIALIVAPHLIGAPEPVSYETPIPEGLHHSFVVAVVLTTLLFWVLLGALAGLIRGRFMHASAG